MNKRIITIIFSLVIAAVPAMAGIVTVDFTSVGGGAILDLNGAAPPGTPIMISGLGFYYDDQGSGSTAAVDSGAGVLYGLGPADPAGPAGIGVLGGNLVVLFPYKTTGLSFNFFSDGTGGNAVLPEVYPFDPAILPTLLLPGDYSLTSNVDGTSTFGYSSLVPFSRFDLGFGNGADSTVFQVNSMQYDTVPEPVSFVLIGAGILGLSCVRRCRRAA